MSDEKDKIEENNDQNLEAEQPDETGSADLVEVESNNDNQEESDSDSDEIEYTIDPNVGRLADRNIQVEMEESYLDYAMSVIVSRALPDVRDGLKPVHRRVLYAMHDLGLRSNAKYRKSATVVGEVLGKYHPHGDSAVYDTMVRLAQDFTMRYPLVDGQGNFGSMDGDGAAAMRYTEARMAQIAEEMLLDIDKETVDWADNYDGSRKEPVVLPARVPQLLLNGTVGIAVGMATNIPPHNLGELCDAISHLIDNPEATSEDLCQFVKAPDFPTGGIVFDIDEIRQAYITGKGKVVIRAVAEIEEAKRGFRIVVTEIPYQVNKAVLVQKIAELVKDKKIDGISDLRDESDRNGVRIVIELRSNSYPRKVLNRLFELTQLQTSFHVNMLALTPNLEPRVMNLKSILSYYIEHRKEVLERRIRYDLRKTEERAHILEGLLIALNDIDNVIETIKKSANREEAVKNLVAGFSLTEIQANAILDMRLSALAALERQRIQDEYDEKMKLIAYYKDLLEHPEKILILIKDDLTEIVEKYGDERRTKIVESGIGKFSAEDLIPDEQVIVSMTRSNYIKRQPIDTYRKQIRGGKGVIGMATKEEDSIVHMLAANTHDDLYIFTDAGRVFLNKVYEVPATSRQSKGIPIVNIIQLGQNEKVTAMLPISKNDAEHSKYFVMTTAKGIIKKTEIAKYTHIRKTGIAAIKLNPSDQLKWVQISTGNDVIVEVSSRGQCICYKESDARPMGRGASGVIGMKLRAGDKVVGSTVIHDGEKYFAPTAGFPDLLVVLENGFGKRTMIKNFNIQNRGGIGIKTANCTPKTGDLIGVELIFDDLGDVLLASKNGQFIRMAVKDIKRLGRDTQGVTLMKMHAGDKVSSVTIVRPDEEKDAEGENKAEKSTEKPAEKKEPVAKKAEKPKAIKSESKKPEKNEKKVEEKKIAKKPALKPEILPATDDDEEPEPSHHSLLDKPDDTPTIRTYDPRVELDDEDDGKKEVSDEPNWWGGQK